MVTVLLLSGAQAAVKTWTGGEQWSSAVFSPPGPPLAGDTVMIDSVSDCSVAGSAARTLVVDVATPLLAAVVVSSSPLPFCPTWVVVGGDSARVDWAKCVTGE